ncbi:hypothetical protein GCM10010967_36310 [Dyadobacter beijingensis]|uniref:Outer membrane protein beta-barrel domain-containing protein n=1 Tax=Dyadobacter beijingensis TaxID=365489 RepID=A0ABQ2I333_9BACT|nr:hypothetical protein [Dyadobacter beijingensis]GGM99061.1 hypothetical protein GCM10010967_36310 [Dyadobacter beijingensis]
MNRKGKHINKYLQAPLPDPEVPADDAWAEMNDMLGAAAGQAVPDPGQPAPNPGQLTQALKIIAQFKGFLIAASAVVTSVMIALILVRQEAPVGKAVQKQSALATAKDSVGESFVEENLMNGDSANAHSLAGDSKVQDISDAGNSSNENTNPHTPDHQSAKNNANHQQAADSRLTNTGRAENHRTNPRSASALARATPARDTYVPARRRATNVQPTPANSGSIENSRSTVNERITDHDNSQNPPVVPRNPGSENTPGSRNNLGNGRNAEGKINPGGRANSPDQNPVDPSTLPAARNASFSQENTPATAAKSISLSSLSPLPGHFSSAVKDFGPYIQKPAIPVAKPLPKARRPVLSSLHFGPEWNLTRGFASTDYLFAGADSVKHPWRIAIPGLFVSQSWNRHSVTLILNPLHSYFGKKEQVAQRVDTVRVTDSLFHTITHNTNFIKSFGLNFSLQYQYQALRWVSLVGGVSYARYSSALLRRETSYSTGTVVDESHLEVKGQESLKTYIRPQQWNLRAGVLLHLPQLLDNRVQVGWTVIVPVSSLSNSGFRSVRSPNMQLSLRFLVK